MSLRDAEPGVIRRHNKGSVKTGCQFEVGAGSHGTGFVAGDREMFERMAEVFEREMN